MLFITFDKINAFNTVSNYYTFVLVIIDIIILCRGQDCKSCLKIETQALTLQYSAADTAVLYITELISVDYTVLTVMMDIISSTSCTVD